MAHIPRWALLRVLQRYIVAPLLLQGRKFDLRLCVNELYPVRGILWYNIFVAVMFWFCVWSRLSQVSGAACIWLVRADSLIAIRAFLFHDGLARVCSEECVQFVPLICLKCKQHQQYVNVSSDTKHPRRQIAGVLSCTWPISGALKQPVLSFI